jgi:YVTN family beta-propeller protein
MRKLVLLLCLAGSVDAAPFLYATRPGNGDVVVVDLATGAITTTLPGGGLPSGAVLNAAGNRVYVADSSSGQLRVFDNNVLVQTVALDPGAAGAALCPGETRLGVALTQTDALAVIDTTTLTVVGTVPAGDQPMAVACADGFFAVANYNSASVTIVDSTTLTVLGTPAAGNFPAGVVVSGARAWVTSLFDSNVTVVALPAATVVATVPVASGPRGIAAGSGRIFVGSVNADTLTVLDAITAGVITTLPLPNAGPTDVLFSPLTGRVYIGHLGEPAITVVDPVALTIESTVPGPVGLMILAGVAQAADAAVIPTLQPMLLALLAIALAFVALRTRGGLAIAFTAVLTAAAAPAALAQTVTGSDTTFAPGDWDVFSAAVGTGGHSASQTNLFGNPQPSRDMAHFTRPLETVRVLHRWLAFSHDPAASGPVTTIDVSWDRNEGGPDCTPGPVMEAFVIYQDGVAYVAAEATFSGSAWSLGGGTGFIASDFDDGGGGEPDFSATGAPIFIGYMRRTTDTVESQFTRCHRIDNLNVTLHLEETPVSTVAFTMRNYFSVVPDDTVVGVTRGGDLTNPASVDVLLSTPGGSTTHTVSWPAGVGGEQTATFTAEEIDGEFPHIGSFGLRLLNASSGTDLVENRERALLYRGESPEAGLWSLLAIILARWDMTGLVLMGTAALYVAVRRRTKTKAASPPASAP